MNGWKKVVMRQNVLEAYQALFDRLVLVRYVIYTNLATDSTDLLVTSSVYEEQLDIVYNKCLNRE